MLSRIRSEAAPVLKTISEDFTKYATVIWEKIEQIPLYKKFFVSGYGVTVDSSGERDLQNFPHPMRREFPAKVHYGFIPDDWFTRFYNKTGVTGPYVFGTTVSSYLLSKEIYVLEHNYYNGISMAILCVMAVKKIGPPLAVYLDGEVDEETNEWNKYREDQFRYFNEAIEGERKAQLSAQAQTMLVDAKHQMVALQLEAAFRERQMEVYREVVRRLDYMVAMSRLHTNFTLEHMASWIRGHVSEQMSKDPELPRRVLSHCIAQLRAVNPQSENRHEGTPAPEDNDGPEAANPGTEEVPAAAATVNMLGAPLLV